MPEDIRVEENAELRRYEVYVDDVLAGIAEYRDAPDRRTMFHTNVEDAFEGRGLAGALAARALDDIRSKGMSVVPTCPFIRSYIERHPGYADLVRA